MTLYTLFLSLAYLGGLAMPLPLQTSTLAPAPTEQTQAVEEQVVPNEQEQETQADKPMSLHQRVKQWWNDALLASTLPRSERSPYQTRIVLAFVIFGVVFFCAIASICVRYSQEIKDCFDSIATSIDLLLVSRRWHVFLLVIQGIQHEHIMEQLNIGDHCLLGSQANTKVILHICDVAGIVPHVLQDMDRQALFFQTHEHVAKADTACYYARKADMLHAFLTSNLTSSILYLAIAQGDKAVVDLVCRHAMQDGCLQKILEKRSLLKRAFRLYMRSANCELMPRINIICDVLKEHGEIAWFFTSNGLGGYFLKQALSLGNTPLRDFIITYAIACDHLDLLLQERDNVACLLDLVLRGEQYAVSIVMDLWDIQNKKEMTIEEQGVYFGIKHPLRCYHWLRTAIMSQDLERIDYALAVAREHGISKQVLELEGDVQLPFQEEHQFPMHYTIPHLLSLAVDSGNTQIVDKLYCCADADETQRPDLKTVLAKKHKGVYDPEDYQILYDDFPLVLAIAKENQEMIRHLADLTLQAGALEEILVEKMEYYDEDMIASLLQIEQRAHQEQMRHQVNLFAGFAQQAATQLYRQSHKTPLQEAREEDRIFQDPLPGLVDVFYGYQYSYGSQYSPYTKAVALHRHLFPDGQFSLDNLFAPYEVSYPHVEAPQPQPVAGQGDGDLLEQLLAGFKVTPDTANAPTAFHYLLASPEVAFPLQYRFGLTKKVCNGLHLILRDNPDEAVTKQIQKGWNGSTQHPLAQARDLVSSLKKLQKMVPQEEGEASFGLAIKALEESIQELVPFTEDRYKNVFAPSA